MILWTKLVFTIQNKLEERQKYSNIIFQMMKTINLPLSLLKRIHALSLGYDCSFLHSYWWKAKQIPKNWTTVTAVLN